MLKELRGIPAARGLARGLAQKWKDATFLIPSFTPVDLVAEKARLAAALQEASRQLYTLYEQVSQRVGDEEAALLEAQAMFLADIVLVSKAESDIDLGINAERAWHQACDYFAIQLESLQDDTLRLRGADVRDVGRRVVEILLGAQTEVLLESQAIILARDLAPSQTATLEPSKVLAFCTVEGGPTSHTAILAKALGIPAIVGIGNELFEIPDGTLLLVDGTTGVITPDPSLELLADFDQRIQAERNQREYEARLASQLAVTVDGHRVEVVANVGSVEDARKALKYGAEGIGLLRTEFLFLNRNQLPDEQVQFAVYRTVFGLMESRPVVIRTLDVGGDKEVPYYDFGAENNPFLGYRAIRISLEHPEEFKTQLSALLRAGFGYDLRIMFPMVATLDEVLRAKSLLREVQAELQSQNAESTDNAQIGIMVEIPSVALLAEQFAREVDFFSIGTNDLTQYTFAAERGNKRVAYLNDSCHPAILRQIARVVQAGHASGKWIGVCGELAGDVDAIPLLLGLGVDELSMSPSLIPHAKQIVRKWSIVAAQALAQKALDLESAEAVRQAVKRSCLPT